MTNEQMDKIGNSMIFLSTAIPGISKTKMLKLLYLLDEFSIKNSGIPFFNLQYKVWKLGPVSEEIFIELSDKPLRFSSYIDIKYDEGRSFIAPKSDFCDDEFSDNDIALLEHIVNLFSKATAKQLIAYTHRPNSPWRNTSEQNGVYDLLESGDINNTEIVIDMSCLVSHDERKKSIFEQYVEEK
jgi:uncharacterized phage-associated protein